MVADLGGTRSDVAVVASRGGMYTVLATAHDYDFAGVHLDNALMEYFAKEFQKKHNTDPRPNPKSLAKLRLESEATKKALSLGTNAQFSVESLADGYDFSLTINRIRYEMVGRKVFEGFNRLVEGAIKKAGLDILAIPREISYSIPPVSGPRPSDFPVADETHSISASMCLLASETRAYTRAPEANCGRVFFVAPSKESWGSVAGAVYSVKVT